MRTNLPGWQWWRLRGNYDPTPILEQIRIPVLVLPGELEWAIPPKESAVAFEQAFKKAGNKDYEIVVLPKANHGLLEAKTGYFSEFPRLNKNVSGYMDKMASWVLENTK